jgi:hypothetical protein
MSDTCHDCGQLVFAREAHHCNGPGGFGPNMRELNRERSDYLAAREAKLKKCDDDGHPFDLDGTRYHGRPTCFCGLRNTHHSQNSWWPETHEVRP